MRKVWIVTGCAFAAIVAIAAIAILSFDVDQFRPSIQTGLEKQLHRPVALGKMSLSLFPFAIRVADLSVGSAPGSNQPPFVTAKDMYVRVGLLALLSKRIEVDALRLAHPAIELVRDKNGKWNTPESGETAGTSGTGSGNTAWSLRELRIDDGSVGIRDLMKGTDRAVYDHIDVTLRDFAPGRTFQFAGRVRAPQAEVALDASGLWDSSTGVMTLPTMTAKIGGVTATGRGEVRSHDNPTTISADLRTDNAPVVDLLRLAAADVTGSGTLSFSVHIEGPASEPAFQGSGKLRDVKLNLPSLRKPIEVHSADIRLTQNRVELENVDGRVASTKLRGNVAVKNFAHPEIEFRAGADRVDIAEMQQLANPSASSGGAPARGQKSLNGSGTLSAGSITYDQLALTDVKANCRLDNGAIRLEPVSARVFGGETQGDITVDTRPGPGAYAVKAALKSVDANKLLSATTSIRQVLFGALSGSTDLQIRPRPGQDIARGLNGTLQLQMVNGRLSGVNLLNELATVAKFLGYSKHNEAFTNILKLGGTLHIQDGIANTDDLQLAFDGGSLTGAGAIGLPDQSLRMRVTAVLPKQVSQAANVSQIGGWMSTVLANRNGELVIPALVTGTFSRPHFAPDAERMAKMKLEGLLPTSGGSQGLGGGLDAVVGALTGKKPQSTNAQSKNESQQPASVLNNLLDGLRKNQDKPQQTR